LIALIVALPDCNALSAPPAQSSSAVAESNAAAQQIYERIAEERLRHGLPPAEQYGEPGPLLNAARAIREGHPPETVLSTLMQRVAHLETTEVRGWVVQVADPDQVGVPRFFVEDPDITIAVVAARHGSTGRFVICFLLIEDDVGADLGYRDQEQ
jgi:hypothetical protein